MRSRFLKTLFAFAILLLVLPEGGGRLWAQCTSGIQQGALVPVTQSTSTVSNVAYTNYVRVAVVRGLLYTIENSAASPKSTSVTDSTGTNAFLSSTLASFTWTAPYSGYIRIYNCSYGGSPAAGHAGTLGVSVSGGRNTLDDSSQAGINVWREHLYERLDRVAAVPTDANAFTRYLGYQDTLGETFSQSFGAGSSYPLKSAGRYLVQSSLDYFAARYLMRSTRPAGAYLATINGDDGIRLYVDNNLVSASWKQQANARLSNQLLPLNGNSLLRLDYYESAGANVVGFNNFVRVANTVSGGGTFCTNTSVTLTGNNTRTDAPVANDAAFTVTYQWERSTDSVNFTDISGATGQNHTVATGSAPEVAYYRRKAFVTRNNTNNGATTSATIPVLATDRSGILRVQTVKPNGTLLAQQSPLCQGQPARLVFTASAGTGPFTLKINGVDYTAISSGVAFVVSPSPPAPSTTVYNLTAITDSRGCLNTP